MCTQNQGAFPIYSHIRFPFGKQKNGFMEVKPMKKNLFAIILAVIMVATAIFVTAPSAKASEAALATQDNDVITISESGIVDLKGFKNVTVNVTGVDVTVSLVDSGNLDDLTGNSAGTAIISGALADWAQYENYKYLPVANADGTYSAHPFNVSITKYGVNPTTSKIALRASFLANDVVAKRITEMGVSSVTAGSYYSANFTLGNRNGAHAYFDLSDSLTADNLDAIAVYGAYVKIGDLTIDSLQTVEIKPADVLAKVNSEFDSYTGKLREKALALYKNNTAIQANLSKLAPRDITSGKLTAGEIDALKNLDLSKLPDVWNLKDAPKAIFKAINIDTGSYFAHNVNPALWETFKWVSDTEFYLPTAPLNNKVSTYYKMMVPDYYGGKFIKYHDKLFTADDFEVGDIFCAQQTSPTKEYYTGIYQGDGKFIMIRHYNNTPYIDTTTVFSETIAEDFDFYYVLRPSLYNSYTQVRDITTGKLTETEKYWLSRITPADVKGKVWLINDFSKTVYKMANIDVSAYLTQSNYNTVGQIFRNESTLGGYHVRPNNYNGYNKTYNTLLLKDCFGGTMIAPSLRKTDFTADNFQIGDMFAGYAPATDNAGKNVYITAMYVGNGYFLIANQLAGTSANSYSYTYTLDNTLLYDADFLNSLTIYYVLRPDQLAK